MELLGAEREDCWVALKETGSRCAEGVDCDQEEKHGWALIGLGFPSCSNVAGLLNTIMYIVFIGVSSFSNPGDQGVVNQVLKRSARPLK